APGTPASRRPGTARGSRCRRCPRRRRRRGRPHGRSPGGAVACVDSADNASHEPFQADARRAYQGRCFAVLRATGPNGTIRVSASADGLQGGLLEMEAVGPLSPVRRVTLPDD
ncbi:MAG: hypothetical protein WAN79_05050, partial [Opitutaceae bacterium]